ncbi:hypothetical protein NGRA_0849 [Nosema granulosis]|uniref:Uncharacterized protein n=1 Tax=Nosema granulosis TaxID=83296 RepID=A0A9P6KZY3_9MICR|nr:hypothetical protein NGRA_0849 [Nosema granulosis]
MLIKLFTLFNTCYSSTRGSYTLDCDIGWTMIENLEKTKQPIMSYEEAIKLLDNLKTEDDLVKISSQISRSKIYEEFAERYEKYSEFCNLYKHEFEKEEEAKKVYIEIKKFFPRIFCDLVKGNIMFPLAKIIYKTHSIPPKKVHFGTVGHVFMLTFLRRITILCLCESYLFEKLGKDTRQIYNPKENISMFIDTAFYNTLSQNGKSLSYNFIQPNSYFYTKLKTQELKDEYKFAYELIIFEFQYLMLYVTNYFKFQKESFTPKLEFYKAKYKCEKANHAVIHDTFFNSTILNKIKEIRHSEDKARLLFHPREKFNVNFSFGDGYSFINENNLINFYFVSPEPGTEKDLTYKTLELGDLVDLKTQHLPFTNSISFNLVMSIFQFYSDKYTLFISVEFSLQNVITAKIVHLGIQPYDQILSSIN